MFLLKKIIEAVSSIAKGWPKIERLSGYLNEPECVDDIKQGFDRPVSVTAALTPFTGICNNV